MHSSEAETDILFLKHDSRILGQSSNPVWFMEEPSQYYMGQTAQSQTCSIMEEPHTVLDDCLNMLLSCFIKRLSGRKPTVNVLEGDEKRRKEGTYRTL